MAVSLSLSIWPLFTIAFSSSMAVSSFSLVSTEIVSSVSLLLPCSASVFSISARFSLAVSIANCSSARSSFMYSFFSSRFSIFFRTILISSSLYLSRSWMNSLALMLSSRRPSIRPSISPMMSLTRSMLALVDASFLSDSAFFVLYITMPAASSNISRLLSVLLLRISEILPCPMMEYPSTPIPVSIMSSRISRSLH